MIRQNMDWVRFQIFVCFWDINSVPWWHFQSSWGMYGINVFQCRDGQNKQTKFVFDFPHNENSNLGELCYWNSKHKGTRPTQARISDVLCYDDFSLLGKSISSRYFLALCVTRVLFPHLGHASKWGKRVVGARSRCIVVPWMHFEQVWF